MKERYQHFITFNDELCCICLNSSNDTKLKSKNNRLEFSMLGKKQKKVIDVDLFLCDSCIKINKATKMNEHNMITQLLTKLHPIIQVKLMKQCGIPIEKNYNEDSDAEWCSIGFEPPIDD
jgi:hypothetical protein